MTKPTTDAGRRYSEQPPGSLDEWNVAILAIEAEAAQGAAPRAEGLDVERNGWWHPADCSNAHNEYGNCLGDDGMVVGWRDPVEYAVILAPEPSTRTRDAE